MNTITVDGRQVTCPKINPADVNEKVFYFHSPEEFHIKTSYEMIDGILANYNETKIPVRRLSYAGVIDGDYLRVGVARCKPGEPFNKKLGRETALSIACRNINAYDNGEGKLTAVDENDIKAGSFVIHVHHDGKPYPTFMRFVRHFEKIREVYHDIVVTQNMTFDNKCFDE